MIVFDLACECGFHFEGWFENRGDFVRQLNNEQLLCPQCGCASVHKILSPVAYQKKSPSSNVGFPSTEQPIKKPIDLHRAASELLKEVQKIVEENFEDVGTEFAQKALKIHYGVEDPKNIRGVIGSDEEELLNNEGITFLKVPMFKQENEKKH